MSSRQPRLLGNLVLAACTTAGFVLLLEAGARMAGLVLDAPLLPNARNCLRRSALLGMEFRPMCRGEFSDATFDTNSLGLRSPEVRDDGSRRILAIGDSCTWGWAVPQDASYPADLQRLLDQRSGRVSYQVVNAGAPGYTSYQGLLYLRERGLALGPAVVILGYGFNDTLTLGDIEEQLRLARRLRWLMLVDDFLVQHSYTYDFVRRHTTRAGNSAGLPRVDPTHFARNLEQMVTLAREHGSHVMMLSFSTTQQGPYAEAMASVTGRLAVPVLAYEGPLLDVVHPTAEGYRMLAARILERLEQEGWLDRPAAPSIDRSSCARPVSRNHIIC